MTKKVKIVIVGGVAGGAIAATRARRLNERAEITILERGNDVSFANCGLPYFISRHIERREQLVLNTPASLWQRYRIKVEVNAEVFRIDGARQKVYFNKNGAAHVISYDKLLLSQGARPSVPEIPGIETATSYTFTLRSLADMDRIDSFIEAQRPKTAIIVGGGFIGVEMAEAFVARGITTRIVEYSPQIMPNLDPEFARMVRENLEAHGVVIQTSTVIKSFEANKKCQLSNGESVNPDLVLFAAGGRPEVELAASAGLRIGETGGIEVNDFLESSDKNIYAVGDMAEVVQRISGKKARIALAGPANRQGRIAGANMANGSRIKYSGALGTGIVKIFDSTLAFTGLTEKAVSAAKLNYSVAFITGSSHASYYPGAERIFLKVVFEKGSGRIFGAQAFGKEGIDKRVDVIATAIMGGLSIQKLAELDLSYAPPYSSANDPLNQVGFIGQNQTDEVLPSLTAKQFSELSGDSFLLLDVRTEAEAQMHPFETSLNIPVDLLRDRLASIPRDKKVITFCQSGQRSYLAQRILLQSGFSDVFNLSGGYWAQHYFRVSEVEHGK